MGASASTLPDTLTKDQASVAFGDGFSPETFDSLAADGVITKSAAIDYMNSTVKNSAFVFIKPHANTKEAQAYVKSALIEAKLNVLAEGEIMGSEIDSKKLIDQHYYAIASKATILKPADLPVPADKFEEFFKESWATVLAEDRTVNAMDACERWSVNSQELEVLWRACEPAGKVVKFGGGFYCGLVDGPEGKPPLYVFNAFFMSMRSKFVGDNSIYYFSVDWDPKDLSWSDFRNTLLGPTDPNDAPESSIRGTILKKYEEFGLKSQPNKGDNGVHASASPLEGLSEKMNWLGKSTTDEPFGSALVMNGFDETTIKDYCVDTLTEGAGDDGVKSGSIFDALEDMDASECLKKCVMVKFGEKEEGRFSVFK